jgi:hypothetical protein
MNFGKILLDLSFLSLKTPALLLEVGRRQMFKSHCNDDVVTHRMIEGFGEKIIPPCQLR